MARPQLSPSRQPHGQTASSRAALYCMPADSPAPVESSMQQVSQQRVAVNEAASDTVNEAASDTVNDAMNGWMTVLVT